MVIAAGQKAPEFSLARASGGEPFTHVDLLGRTTVLVFYPFAFSPVCTDQLSVYNELLDDLLYAGWVHPWMQHVPILGSYYDSDVKASYLASLIGALLLLQTLIFNRGGIGAQLRPIARWMTGHRFELHDETDSGPAAVEGSSVRA